MADGMWDANSVGFPNSLIWTDRGLLGCRSQRLIGLGTELAPTRFTSGLYLTPQTSFITITQRSWYVASSLVCSHQAGWSFTLPAACWDIVQRWSWLLQRWALLAWTKICLATTRCVLPLFFFFFLKRETDELSSSRRVRRATCTNPRCSPHCYFPWRKQQRSRGRAGAGASDLVLPVLWSYRPTLWAAVPMEQGSERRRQVRPVKRSGLWSIFGQHLNGVSDCGSCRRRQKKPQKWLEMQSKTILDI